jgi:hypothetical protein
MRGDRGIYREGRREGRRRATSSTSIYGKQYVMAREEERDTVWGGHRGNNTANNSPIAPQIEGRAQGRITVPPVTSPAAAPPTVPTAVLTTPPTAPPTAPATPPTTAPPAPPATAPAAPPTTRPACRKGVESRVMRPYLVIIDHDEASKE